MIVNGKTYTDQHFSRVVKFTEAFLTSHNQHVLLIANRARYNTFGALGRNMTRCESAGGLVPPSDAALVARAQSIRELIDVRDGLSDLEGFSHDEVKAVLRGLCCDKPCHFMYSYDNAIRLSV